MNGDVLTVTLIYSCLAIRAVAIFMLPWILNQGLSRNTWEVHSNLWGAKQVLCRSWDPNHCWSKRTRLVQGDRPRRSQKNRVGVHS